MKKCTLEEAVSFYIREAEKFDFSLAALDCSFLKEADFYGLYQDGNLKAAGYVVNQQKYKQYVVTYYKGIYKFLSRLPMGWMGYPDFPKFGTPANCASAGFWVKKDVGKERDDFLEKVSYLWNEMLRDSINYSFLIIGFHESDSMIPAVENGKHILYKSRFYEVSWDGKQISGTRGIRMEVALL